MNTTTPLRSQILKHCSSTRFLKLISNAETATVFVSDIPYNNSAKSATNKEFAAQGGDQWLHLYD